MRVNVGVMSDAIELLIGTYTRGTGSQGIYRCLWNTTAHRFEDLELAAPADNPSFLINAGAHLFAVSEVNDHLGQPQGAVLAYRRDGPRLSLLQVQPSFGADPCHLGIHQGLLAVANYTGGSLCLLDVDAGAGTGGQHAPLLRPRQLLRLRAAGPTPRQAGAHPHGAWFRGDELWVPDLGGDRIYRLRAATGQVLDPVLVAPGSGPRHLALRGGRVYVIHELSNRVELIEQGRVVQSVPTLPDGAWRSATAAIAIRPDGRSLIASNRGHDSLVSFAIDPSGGYLSEPRLHSCGGSHPRDFALTRDGRWLLVANRDSDNLLAMPMGADGRPGAPVAELPCPAPVCILEC
ncbi:MAG: lactonase family protein [Pseudomonadales bacterium]